MALLMKPEPFSSEINRLFDTLFEPTNANRAQRWAPAMDLVEGEDHFLLKADLPGLGEDDVSIEVQDNVLTISGERKAESERKEKGFYRLERSFGRVSRDQRELRQGRARGEHSQAGGAQAAADRHRRHERQRPAGHPRGHGFRAVTTRRSPARRH